MSEDTAPVPSRKKMSGKKLVLFIILPLLLLGGGAGAVWFLLFNSPEEEAVDVASAEGGHVGDDGERVVDPEHPPIYFEMDEMTVNLTSTTKKNSYLKLKIVLELGAEEDQEAVTNVLPRVVDQFQIYLRGVRVEDIQGSEGSQRLRDELLLRAKKAAQPANVTGVLFKVFQVQ